jgi:Spy/CpxP family protein refolding chaperone
MKLMSSGTIVGLFGFCALGSFIATYAWQSQPARPETASQPSEPLRALRGWLGLMPRQIESIAGVDPDFAAESAELERTLASERDQLARLFEDPVSSDEVITRQVEAVIEAHDQLERRVAKHLLELRPLLTDEQRSKLFQRCARGIREAGGWRWRHGRGGAPGGGQGEGLHEGRGGGGHGGPPPGRGPGRGGGRGPRWRNSTDEKPTSRPSSDEKGNQP